MDTDMSVIITQIRFPQKIVILGMEVTGLIRVRGDTHLKTESTPHQLDASEIHAHIGTTEKAKFLHQVTDTVQIECQSK